MPEDYLSPEGKKFSKDCYYKHAECAELYSKTTKQSMKFSVSTCLAFHFENQNALVFKFLKKCKKRLPALKQIVITKVDETDPVYLNLVCHQFPRRLRRLDFMTKGYGQEISPHINAITSMSQ